MQKGPSMLKQKQTRRNKIVNVGYAVIEMKQSGNKWILWISRKKD